MATGPSLFGRYLELASQGNWEKAQAHAEMMEERNGMHEQFQKQHRIAKGILQFRTRIQSYLQKQELGPVLRLLSSKTGKILQDKLPEVFSCIQYEAHRAMEKIAEERQSSKREC